MVWEGVVGNSLQDTADGLLRAVHDALAADDRPVCKHYTSLGTPIILTCCECDDIGSNGEVSIHFRRLFDADPSSLDEVRRVRPCRGGVTAAQFRIVVARCSPIINERGEIPEPDEYTDAANDQLRDVELLWGSLASAGRELRIDDVSVDLGEPGMCSVVFADVTAAVHIPTPPLGITP